MTLPRPRSAAAATLTALALAALPTPWGVAYAQLRPTLPPGLATVAAAIEDAALEAFAGPDRLGKDGPLAALGLDLARIFATSGVPGGLEALRGASGVDGAPVVRDDRVLIDATAVGTGAELLRDLETLGLRNGVAFGRVVSGELPIAALPQAAALTSLQAATAARAVRAVGAVTSQGDASMRADAARTLFGVDGTGVAVGTLSDSYDCSPGASTSAADDVATGDLPTGIVVLDELGACVNAIDEGRAMMQLIHDVAPGATQLFHTAFEGQASFAQGILDLAAAGADVIVDDVFYFAEPFFQDGIIAQAVDQVVAAGVPYFSSMGNHADQSYESAYRAATPTGPFVGNVVSLHDFDPGDGVDTFQEIFVPAGASFTIILQWDDPFASAGVGNPGAAGDVDLFVTNQAGSSIIAQSAIANLGGDPFEIIQAVNPGGAFTAGIAIGLWGGVQPTTVKYVYLGNVSVSEYDTNSATGFGHANAAGALGVGAAWYAETPAFGQDPPLRESFSSLGGVPIYFDTAGNRLPAPVVRSKPEITAPDGTDTTFFGFDVEPNGFPNFFGTSAAAPHAAALTALLLELAPTATPAEIRAVLAQTAIDMDAPGFDFWTGDGLVQADAALLAFAGTVGFGAPTYDALEGDGVVTVTVTRTGGSAGAISVGFATSDGTAIAGVDYVAASGVLDWADGDASPKTIDVPLLDDAIVDADVGFAVTLSNPVGTAIDLGDTTVTIANDDFAGTVGFTSATYDAAEGAGAASITVARTGGSAGTISVDYATSDGTATAGSEYTAVSGTLTWDDGDAASKTIDVPLLDDANVDGDADLSLTLSNPVDTTIDRADATLTITDDDPSLLAAAKGPASPGATLQAAPGDRSVVLQLVLTAPSGALTATIDALTAQVATTGTAGAPTDVAAVRLYLDADADGAVDAGSSPIAVAAPDAAGDLVLAPTGLSVAADETRMLLVELEFDASLATLPTAVPLFALALPMLFGLAGVRRRTLLGVALLAVVVVAACSPPSPPRSTDVTIEVVAIDASTPDPGVTVSLSGLPIVGSTVTVTE